MTTLERQSVFSQEIVASQSRPEWLQTVSRLTKTFGFTHTTLMKVPTQGDDLLAPVVLETTVPVNFIRSVDQHRKTAGLPYPGENCQFIDAAILVLRRRHSRAAL